MSVTSGFLLGSVLCEKAVDICVQFLKGAVGVLRGIGVRGVDEAIREQEASETCGASRHHVLGHVVAYHETVGSFQLRPTKDFLVRGCYGSARL